MPTGDAHGSVAERGFSYLLLLFGLAVTSATLAAAGTAWANAAQREREAELLFRGEQFRRAIAGYHRTTPEGSPRYPATLIDLLDDQRGATPQRHLRRIYTDPCTGAADWVLVRVDGRIHGLHSRCDAPVLRSKPQGNAGTAARLSDWRFVHEADGS